MKINQKIDHITFEFLKSACYIVKGDTEKSVEIMRIWRDLNINDSSEEYPIEVIVNTVDFLKQQNFIEDGETYNELRVTYDGIYYVISMPDARPANYGVISMEEMKRLCPDILRFIYQRTRYNTTDSLPLTNIKLKSYGESVVRQIVQFLKQQGSIELFRENGEIKTRIASNGIMEIDGEELGAR
jgi:hypothetical protein